MQDGIVERPLALVALPGGTQAGALGLDGTDQLDEVVLVGFLDGVGDGGWRGWSCRGSRA
jgi:hypothetical protein